MEPNMKIQQRLKFNVKFEKTIKQKIENGIEQKHIAVDIDIGFLLLGLLIATGCVDTLAKFF